MHPKFSSLSKQVVLTLGLAVILTSVLIHYKFQFSQKTPFYIARDGKFYKQNRQIQVYSANYWQAMNLGFSEKAKLKQDLDDLKRFGVNNIRIMVGSEGPDGEPFRIVPSLMPLPNIYNFGLLKGLDFVLAELSKREISVTICLNNYWHWSGGFAQYVSWVTNSKIPYPPSWDPVDKKLTNGSFDDYTNYADRFYKDSDIYTKVSNLFKTHLLKIVGRKNSITGLDYKNDTNIFAWELANEPQFPSSDWVSEMAGYIKSIDANHMVTVGLESRFNENEFRNAHLPSFVDYCTVHVWAQNRGMYDMLDPSEENIENAISWALGWIDKTHSWAKKVGKPLLLEEFGMPRDNFDGEGYVYSPKHGTSRRDRYFDKILERVAELSNQNFGGFGFWAYSGTSRPGDKWVADPPHEPPGWYGIYNTDKSTLAIMFNAHRKALHNSNFEFIDQSKTFS